MSLNDLFDKEDSIISLATSILETKNHDENPLLPHFSKLLTAYSKLFKQHKRIIRLSDKQHSKLSILNSEMKNILDNIPVGIVIIDKDGIITPSYSLFMHQLFWNTKKIASADIANLLYWEKDRRKERSTFKKWLPLVFDLAYDWELIGGLGPDLIHHETEKGSLYYRNSFHRIIHDNGDLYLMIYITDISERMRQRIALKEQKTAHNFELEVLSCIVNNESPVELIDFIHDTKRMLNECHNLFDGLHRTEDRAPIYNHMFRLMHSIKGNSRTYGLHELGFLAHSSEDILDQYRSNEISFQSGMIDGGLASDKLQSIIDTMKKLLIKSETIIHKILNQGKENAAAIRSRRRGLKMDEESMDDLIKKVENLKVASQDPNQLPNAIDHILDNMFQLTLQPLDVVFNRLHMIVKDVSESLDKQAELITEGDKVFLDPDTHHQIINALIHILRNSLDHGIELPHLRSELGKSPIGRIQIKTFRDNQTIRIVISDDGKGIDAHTVAEKAVLKGFVAEKDVRGMTDQEKTELILLPGFSVKESVTELSGRGVGMDVVAEAMKNLNGQMTIHSELDRGTTIQVEFPVKKRSGSVHP